MFFANRFDIIRLYLLDMKIYLYIDTSSEVSSIALLDQSRVIAQRTNLIQKEHASVISVHIEEICKEGGIALATVAGVIVMNGPGSYTGLRVGLSTAKGICYALSLPLYLINKLAFYAYVIHRQFASLNSFYIIAQARVGEYYGALYSGDVSSLQMNIYTQEQLLNATEHALFSYEVKLFSLPSVQTIKSNKEDLLTYCQFIITRYEDADVLLAEPFYLKNVHINKINKL